MSFSGFQSLGDTDSLLESTQTALVLDIEDHQKKSKTQNPADKYRKNNNRSKNYQYERSGLHGVEPDDVFLFEDEVQSQSSQSIRGSVAEFETEKKTDRQIETETEDEVEDTAPWRDVRWVIIFYVHLLVVLAIFIIGLVKISTSHQSDDPNHDDSDWSVTSDTATTTGQISLVLLIEFSLSLCLSLLCIRLLYISTRVFFYFSQIWFLAVFVALSVVILMTVSSVGLKSFLLVLFWIVWAFFFSLFYFWRDRLDFSVMMIKIILSVFMEYPATVFTLLFVFVFCVMYLCVWIFSIMFIFLSWRKEEQDGSGYIFVVYLFFSLFWTTQVLKNVLNVSYCGLFATWYYKGENMPKDPTKKAFYRAISTSFGSISFGSLFVAPVHLLLSLFRSLSSDTYSTLCCVNNCLFDLCLDVSEFVNIFAFVQMAVYGRSLCDSARQTHSLFESVSLIRLINDSLISTLLLCLYICLSLSVALLSSVAYISIVEDHETHFALCVLYFLILSSVCVNLVLQIIESGVTSLFVCVAEHPLILRDNHPSVYQKLYNVWPQIETHCNSNNNLRASLPGTAPTTENLRKISMSLKNVDRDTTLDLS